MGHLEDSKRIRLKGCTTKIRLGPTTMRIKIEIFPEHIFKFKINLKKSR
jgi:hypothetical protein